MRDRIQPLSRIGIISILYGETPSGELADTLSIVAIVLLDVSAGVITANSCCSIFWFSLRAAEEELQYTARGFLPEKSLLNTSDLQNINERLSIIN